MLSSKSISKHQVKISDIVNGVLMQRQNLRTYLNKKSGKTVMVAHEIVQMAEGDYALDYYSEWWQEVVEFTQDMLAKKGPDRQYVELPEIDQIINESVMNEFCKTVDGLTAEKLKRSLQKASPQQKFEKAVEKFSLQTEWDTFRKIALHKASIKWCNQRRIPFVLE